jgi:uncharacterized protein YhbP (UPF0306 family)
MTIQLSKRPVAAARIAALARDLLEASSLCAIATAGRRRHAYVNTAYFAWSPELELVWLSAPEAQHSRNLRSRPSAAVAVYDSRQAWGGPDRGIQLFGSARAVEGRAARSAAALYEARFPEFREAEVSGYRLYRFRPRRLKVFDERTLGGGVFVTARVAAGGLLAWERTEVYRPSG